MNRNQRLELVAGDDWQLDAVLLDASGNLLNLTGATLTWTLIDSFGWTAPATHTITLGANPGECIVKVAAANSSPIKGGGYMAYWRVTISGLVQTPLVWPLGIHADPFIAQPEPAAAKEEPAIERLERSSWRPAALGDHRTGEHFVGGATLLVPNNAA
jgi:hypothetical protein